MKLKINCEVSGKEDSGRFSIVYAQHKTGEDVDGAWLGIMLADMLTAVHGSVPKMHDFMQTFVEGLCDRGLDMYFSDWLSKEVKQEQKK